jgi:hypothetical protein
VTARTPPLPPRKRGPRSWGRALPLSTSAAVPTWTPAFAGEAELVAWAEFVGVCRVVGLRATTSVSRSTQPRATPLRFPRESRGPGIGPSGMPPAPAPPSPPGPPLSRGKRGWWRGRSAELAETPARMSPKS